MPHFRKKPVVIEAVQFTNDQAGTLAAYKFLHGEDSVKQTCRMSEDRWDVYSENLRKNGIKIPTLEGEMVASPGDWIIKGVNGEMYPCKPDIFEKTYDPVL